VFQDDCDSVVNWTLLGRFLSGVSSHLLGSLVNKTTVICNLFQGIAPIILNQPDAGPKQACHLFHRYLFFLWIMPLYLAASQARSLCPAIVSVGSLTMDIIGITFNSNMRCGIFWCCDPLIRKPSSPGKRHLCDDGQWDLPRSSIGQFSNVPEDCSVYFSGAILYMKSHLDFLRWNHYSLLVGTFTQTLILS
jgi:hypothetical protein